MIRRSFKASIILLFSLLVGCITHTHEFIQSQVKDSLFEENWRSRVDTDPVKWKKHADNWLWFGQANSVEQEDRKAPYSDAMSTMMVRVPDFTQIVVNGDFQVQLDGRFQHNSVYLLGPNDEMRQVVVEVKDHTLDIHLVEKNTDPRKVIVRIAIRNLQNLVQNGSGKIQGRFVRACPLLLTSTGTGDIILTGKLNVRRITQSGSGSITLLGVYTPALRVESTGSGSLNLSGRVGIESIKHSGSGDVNIIGADTNSLFITTTGSGKIGIAGIANVKQINASGDTSTYLYVEKSKDLYVYMNGNSTVGLAGETKNLYVDAKDTSSFLGRYLHSRYTYLRTRQWAHINAAADERAFAAANENSSIYLIGRPDVISPYVNDNAVVIPIEPPPETPTQVLEYRKKKAGKFGGETYLP